MAHATKMLQGAFLGAVISGAAILWWNSESGKETREHVKESWEDFYDDSLAPALKKAKRVGYRKYKKFLKYAAEEFGNMKELSEEKIDELLEKTHQVWDNFGGEKS